MNISIEQVKAWIAELFIANKMLEEEVEVLKRELEKLKGAKKDG